MADQHPFLPFVSPHFQGGLYHKILLFPPPSVEFQGSESYQTNLMSSPPLIFVLLGFRPCQAYLLSSPPSFLGFPGFRAVQPSLPQSPTSIFVFPAFRPADPNLLQSPISVFVFPTFRPAQLSLLQSPTSVCVFRGFLSDETNYLLRSLDLCDFIRPSFTTFLHVFSFFVDEVRTLEPPLLYSPLFFLPSKAMRKVCLKQSVLPSQQFTRQKKPLVSTVTAGLENNFIGEKTNSETHNKLHITHEPPKPKNTSESLTRTGTETKAYTNTFNY